MTRGFLSGLQEAKERAIHKQFRIYRVLMRLLRRAEERSTAGEEGRVVPWQWLPETRKQRAKRLGGAA